MIKISTPLTKETLRALKCGQEILLTGTINTARDRAHKKLIELIKKGRKLPIDFKNQIIYYCGPTPAPKNKTIGSCGPTTSARMDELTIPLFKKGLKGMIGKGRRCADVTRAIKKYKAIYFLTYAGCGALLSQKVKRATSVAFKDLGPEAIYKLEVKDFPLIVAVDSKGRSIL